MKAGRLVGHYFLVLAIISLLWMVASPFLGKGFHLDLGFLLYCWIGDGLLEGRKRARIWAIVLCGFGVAISLAFAVLMVVPSDSWPTSAKGPDLSTSLAIIYVTGALLGSVSPLVLLLHPSTRQAYRDEAPHERTFWASRQLASYVAIGMCFITVFMLLEASTATTSLSGSSHGFNYGADRMGMSVVKTVVADNDGPPLYISAWVLGESNTCGSTSSPYGVSIGSYAIQLPEPRVTRYLRHLGPPAGHHPAANVFIVRASGEVIRLNRRVTPTLLPAAEECARTSKDFDHLQRSLENILPAVNAGK